MAQQRWAQPQGWGAEQERWERGLAVTPPTGGIGDVGRYADGLLQSLSGRNPDLLDAAEEVAADQAAHICLVSRRPELPPQVLAYLRRAAVAPLHGSIVHHGVWVLAALPSTPALDAAPPADAASADTSEFTPAPEDAVETLLGRLSEDAPDIVLYLAALAAGWDAEDTVWVGRLRTLGAPLLPVVVEESGAPETQEQALAAEARTAMNGEIRRRVGVKAARLVIDAVDAASPEGDKAPAAVVALAQRIVALRPRVAVALAQDVAWCRPILARRIIRTGALLTGLVSAQPVPLLDLPFQVALQWKVAMQIAAIYGRPGLDYRSREMMGTIAWNLLIRFVMQQAARFVPVLGWALSAGIGWVSTTLLGHALVTIYEHEDRWALERARVAARAGAAVAPVRAASVRAADAVRGQAEALSQRVGSAGQTVQAAWRRHQAHPSAASQTPASPATVPGADLATPDAGAADGAVCSVPVTNLAARGDRS